MKCVYLAVNLFLFSGVIVMEFLRDLSEQRRSLGQFLLIDIGDTSSLREGWHIIIQFCAHGDLLFLFKFSRGGPLIKVSVGGR